MTTYSPSLRFWEGVPGDPAVRNAWGTFLNTNFTLLDSAITGISSINIAGLATYSLTTANGSADQARELMQSFTGALTGDCTVTLPNVQKVGWTRNATTGSHNVILTSGGGAQATIPPDTSWYFYRCDGTGNVVVFSVGFSTVRASTLEVTGSATVATAGTFGNQVVNFSQFGQSRTNPGYVHLPGGLICQFGNVLSNGAGAFSVTFATPFATNVFSIVASARAPFGNGVVIADPPSLSSFSGSTGSTTTGTVSGPVHVDWQAIGV